MKYFAAFATVINALRFNGLYGCVNIKVNSYTVHYVHVCGLCLISFPRIVTKPFNLTNIAFRKLFLLWVRMIYKRTNNVPILTKAEEKIGMYLKN